MELDTLLQEIQKDNRKAFDKLVLQYNESLNAFAFNILKDKEAAEDIVQDVFFKLWSTPQKFLHTTDLRFYLYRSVQNGCLNYIRNKKVEEGYRNKAEMVTEDFFYNVLLEEEIFIRLRKAVDELPEKYRVVINLNLDGLSDKEIAERLGITLDAVKQQKKRGKERLREHLDHPFLILFLIFL